MTTKTTDLAGWTVEYGDDSELARRLAVLEAARAELAPVQEAVTKHEKALRAALAELSRVPWDASIDDVAALIGRREALEKLLASCVQEARRRAEAVQAAEKEITNIRRALNSLRDDLARAERVAAAASSVERPEALATLDELRRRQHVFLGV